MENKFAAFLSDLTNTNRSVISALDSKFWIRAIAPRYKLEDRIRFVNLFRNINFREDACGIHVDNMYMLRKLIRRIRRFNARFNNYHLKRRLDVSRQQITVFIKDYPIGFDIWIATETSYVI